MSEIVKVNVKCLLNEYEKVEKGKMLAEKVSRIEVLTEEKTAKAKRYKTDIDKLNAEAIELSVVISDGFEYRDIECRMVKNYKERVVEFIDIETGELVQTRPFGQGDNQQSIFDGGDTYDRIEFEGELKREINNENEKEPRKGNITVLGR